MTAQRFSFPLFAALGVLLAGLASSAPSRRPLIYVYDLPERLHDAAKFGNEIRAPSCFYALDSIFPKLIRESPYYTNNSQEADFFYVRGGGPAY